MANRGVRLQVDGGLGRGSFCSHLQGLLVPSWQQNPRRSVPVHFCFVNIILQMHPESRHLPLEPDFNHVWLEFYVPGVGWLPMESNVDDVIERGPYPQRYFMGLAWYHTELGKGMPFSKLNAVDKPEKLSVRHLAINHIRFQILDELVPTGAVTASPNKVKP